MKKETCKDFCISIFCLMAFVLLTVLLRLVDVQPIGPNGSSVGFATANQIVHNFTGVNWYFYYITDLLSIIPIFIVIGFAVFGLFQWINRKDIRKVDCDILLLGGLYIVVAAVYLLFETIVVNYRPVLVDGLLEPSYPSSTTMLVLCVMSTALIQIDSRLGKSVLKKILLFTIVLFVFIMVTFRLISGVHWFTDIVAGALLSIGLVLLYKAVAFLFINK
ncbi:MAG: phosphatase PAP2 family protein [Clostridia bacterium]|nr:phosphatase PAP2 family protein [Clostridia bacterium]